MSEFERRQSDWESRYRAGTTAWDRGETSPALRHWLEHAELTPCRILVPGCGRGHEVAELARRGFAVTAVDIAPAAVRAVQELLAGAGLHAEVIQADLLDWEPEYLFDAIYEQTCLCALEPGLLEEYAKRLWSWLKPGGRLYVLFMQTHKPGGPPYHCDLADMHTLFDGRRWYWPNTEPLQVPHPTGLHELGLVLVKR